MTRALADRVIVVGGLLTTWLVRDDPRCEVWLPAVCYVFAIPMYAATLLCSSTLGAFAFKFVAVASIAASMGAALSSIQSIVARTYRATAVAVILFSASLLGLGLAPLLVGMLSDAYAAWAGADSLRYAMITSIVFLLVPIVHFQRAGAAWPRARRDRRA